MLACVTGRAKLQESNPDVVNKYIRGMGVSPDWEFHGVCVRVDNCLWVSWHACGDLLVLLSFFDAVYLRRFA